MLRIASTAVGATLLASAAAAQITVIATDSFEYPTPGLIQNAGGGTGWASAWDQPNGNGNEIVLFDQNVMPVMTCADMSGAYVGQATEFVAAQRIPDQFGHGDVTESGYFGADGSTIWISFRTQMYQQFGMGSFGAVQLWDTNNQAEERMLLGSPWGTSAWEWGWDQEGGNGLPPEYLVGSDASVCAKLVFRIDHMPGDERIRMWVDPAVDYPTTPADLDGTILDLRWDEIRLNSGGSGTHFFWDDLVIAKGVPSSSVGTAYCGPAVVNSTGQSAEIDAQGSLIAASNDMTLVASGLANNAFGFFLTSQTQGFVMNPGGSAGNLCLGGAIGRYVGPGQIQQANNMGTFSLGLDLSQHPTPGGLVQVTAGQTWNFTTWYRDSVGGMATSNFTNGVSVDFQ